MGNGDIAPIYVLDGIAGIGKSTIAQTIAEWAAEARLLGASFFFTRNEEQRSTAKHFFPTIAFHLARYNPPFSLRLAKVLEQDPDAAQQTINHQLALLILQPLRDLPLESGPPLLVVIDALDECKEKEARTLLSLLAQNIHDMPQLRYFITARPEWHIRNVLNQDRSHRLFRLHEIEESIVEADIRRYLISHLSITHVQKRFPGRRLGPWPPNPGDVDILCGMCGTLFIIASTAVKYILDNKANPETRITRLIKAATSAESSRSEPTHIMDRMYIQIICSAAPNNLEDEEWISWYKTAVGSVIVLQIPLPCQALAALLAIDPGAIEDALMHLHSLVAPTGLGNKLTFKVHHKSFPDFITSEERIENAVRSLGLGTSSLSTRFLINVKEHHLQMAKACFGMMDCHLHRNMANLSPDQWHKNKADIEDLHQWTISNELAYAVRYWASHLHASGYLDEDLWHQLYRWASTHILAWLEAMCLLNQIGDSFNILKEALDSVVSCMVSCINYVHSC
jgi:hypothetical protein